MNAPKRLTGDGLMGYYFNGYAFQKLITRRIDPTINFFYDGQVAPASGVRGQSFSVRWTGQLLAPVSGQYAFSSIADDGVRITIGGVKVMEEWRYRGHKLFSRRVHLQAGRFYEIKVDYVNYKDGGYIDLDWELPQKQQFAATGFIKERQIIPTRFLFSDPVLAPPTPVTPVAPPPAKPIAAIPPKKPGLTPPKPTPAKSGQPSVGALATVKPVAPVEPPITLTPGSTLILKKVLFVQGEYTLLPESFKALNELIMALKKYPAARIELAGHTDNAGDQRLNRYLSENRAQVVANYLNRHGIKEDAITIKGYGGTRPLVSNDTEEGRAQNRRVELTVLAL